FPLDQVESSVDYAFVQIGGNSVLLPSHAEGLGCDRPGGGCNRNVIDFRDYRKYTADLKDKIDQGLRTGSRISHESQGRNDTVVVATQSTLEFADAGNCADCFGGAPIARPAATRATAHSTADSTGRSTTCATDAAITTGTAYVFYQRQSRECS